MGIRKTTKNLVAVEVASFHHVSKQSDKIVQKAFPILIFWCQQPLQRCICIQNVQSLKQRDLKACHVLNSSQCFADKGKVYFHWALELMHPGRWQVFKLIHTSRNWVLHNKPVILDYVPGKCPKYKFDCLFSQTHYM